MASLVIHYFNLCILQMEEERKAAKKLGPRCLHSAPPRRPSRLSQPNPADFDAGCKSDSEQGCFDSELDARAAAAFPSCPVAAAPAAMAQPASTAAAAAVTASSGGSINGANSYDFAGASGGREAASAGCDGAGCDSGLAGSDCGDNVEGGDGASGGETEAGFAIERSANISFSTGISASAGTSSAKHATRGCAAGADASSSVQAWGTPAERQAHEWDSAELSQLSSRLAAALAQRIAASVERAAAASWVA